MFYAGGGRSLPDGTCHICILLAERWKMLADAAFVYRMEYRLYALFRRIGQKRCRVRLLFCGLVSSSGIKLDVNIILRLCIIRTRVLFCPARLHLSSEALRRAFENFPHPAFAMTDRCGKCHPRCNRSRIRQKLTAAPLDECPANRPGPLHLHARP